MASPSKIVSNVLKTTVISAAVAAASIPVVNAGGHEGPKLTGRLSYGILQAGSRDHDLWAAKADLGVSAVTELDNGMKVKYELIADFAGELNGVDANGETWTSGDSTDQAGDIYVHTARSFLITDYGMLLVAPRTHSGQWYQLYGNVDKFEYNRMHSQTGQGAIFGQPEQANDVIAYVSPAFGDGFRFIAAALTISDYNEEDLDAIAYRLVYKKDALNAGAGQVIVSDKQTGSDTLTRTAATAGYDFGMVSLGGTYENISIGDVEIDAFAVVAEADVSEKTSVAVGYADKEHSANEAANKTGMMAKIKYQASKSTYMYLEGGQYSGDNDVEYVDNYIAGLSVSF